MQAHPIYLPGLNGIRAIAALGVVFSHITRRGADFGLNPFIFGSYKGDTVGWDLAEFGVTMFFVLSGFLITYLLLVERTNGEISIAKFYMRRILRIWPLYYFYIILCLVIWLIFQLSVDFTMLPYYLLFSANIPFMLSSALPLLVHYWSLGVEEQFYIFWPWLSKLSNQRLLQATLILILGTIGAKLALHALCPGSFLEKFIHITRYHCMLIGCLSAILFFTKNRLFYLLATNMIVQLIAWCGFFLIILNQFHFISVLDNEFVAVLISILIIGQISKKGILSLENHTLNILGKWSFGIYVYHPILIFLFSKFMVNITSYNLINYPLVYGSIFLSTLVVAAISYRYLEKPFLMLKDSKFSVVKSSNSPTTNQPFL